jgi:hypothetical protein
MEEAVAGVTCDVAVASRASAAVARVAAAASAGLSWSFPLAFVAAGGRQRRRRYH